MEQPAFGGKAGEPVPQVSSEDFKNVWKKYEELTAGSEVGACAVGVNLLASLCHGGSDVEAVAYRVMMLQALLTIAPDELAPWHSDLGFADSVFNAAAKVPMEWIGKEVRQGLPLDIDELRKLCAAP